MALGAEYVLKSIVEGALMKLGDVILVHSPSLVKEGTVVAIILIRKKLQNKKKEKPSERILQGMQKGNRVGHDKHGKKHPARSERDGVQRRP